jgi:hypothetical protein
LYTCVLVYLRNIMFDLTNDEILSLSKEHFILVGALSQSDCGAA